MLLDILHRNDLRGFQPLLDGKILFLQAQDGIPGLVLDRDQNLALLKRLEAQPRLLAEGLHLKGVKGRPHAHP
ncbi:MAG: hypothetical protein CVU68_04335 [Deltaproteobacteria bacterium HGW-Deltaproteobacteria-3]|nr:MAG: hypothetical protein CVU68_04335 [Deltaproteobacteria bacterium HGW-Deltaproteobacteria-3]